jgi:dTDP-glucose 4,6-dehydratase
MLEGALQNRSVVKRFVHVSTDEVYGENAKGEKFSELASTFAPSNPYAATKACGALFPP